MISNKLCLCTINEWYFHLVCLFIQVKYKFQKKLIEAVTKAPMMDFCRRNIFVVMCFALTGLNFGKTIKPSYKIFSYQPICCQKGRPDRISILGYTPICPCSYLDAKQ